MSVETADIALILSALSAIGSFISALFTAKMARNSSKGMKRPKPTLEIERNRSSKPFENWDCFSVIVRNHADVGLIALRIRSKRGKYINSFKELMSKNTDGFGTHYIAHPPSEKREAIIDAKLDPIGSRGSDIIVKIGDTYIHDIFTKNVKSVLDLKLIYEWADGQNN